MRCQVEGEKRGKGVGLREQCALTGGRNECTIAPAYPTALLSLTPPSCSGPEPGLTRDSVHASLTTHDGIHMDLVDTAGWVGATRTSKCERGSLGGGATHNSEL